MYQPKNNCKDNMSQNIQKVKLRLIFYPETIFCLSFVNSKLDFNLFKTRLGFDQKRFETARFYQI